MSAGDRTPGRRKQQENPPNIGVLEPGEYLRDALTGHWYGCTPNGHLAGLAKHQVAEHEDGTITVAPSILVSNAEGPLWHGYLERGVWREV